MNITKNIPGNSYTRENFHNAADWQNTFQDILNYGQQGINYGQQGLNIITGNQPITSGDLPGGHGNYDITLDPDRDEKKVMGIPVPYFIGGVIVLGVVAFFVGSQFYKPGNK